MLHILLLRGCTRSKFDCGGGTEGTVEAAAGSPRRDTDAPQAIIITISINTIIPITIIISRGRKEEEEEESRPARRTMEEQMPNAQSGSL